MIDNARYVTSQNLLRTKSKVHRVSNQGPLSYELRVCTLLSVDYFPIAFNLIAFLVDFCNPT